MLETIPIPTPFLPKPREVYRLLGYPSAAAVAPESRKLIERQRRRAASLIQPWVGFTQVSVTGGNEDSVELACGTRLHGRPLAELLRGCAEAVLCVVTIGEALERAVGALQERGEPAEAVVLDAVGSAAVEALQRQTGQYFCARHEPRGLHVTRHYSPGYTGWETAEQRLLFESLERCGFSPPVRLNDHAMMIPRKSLSSIWGLTAENLSANRAANRIGCRSCDLDDCSFRRAPYEPKKGE